LKDFLKKNPRRDLQRAATAAAGAVIAARDFWHLFLLQAAGAVAGAAIAA